MFGVQGGWLGLPPGGWDLEELLLAGPLAGRSSTGSWTRATTRRRTPATSSGRCWRLSPTCTHSRSSTGTSRSVVVGWEHPWALVCPQAWHSQPLLRQLENLVYYNRLKNSKIVISDFHLAKLENGLIKEPCGTPEYLGR